VLFLKEVLTMTLLLLLQGTCSNCGMPVRGLKNRPFDCRNCGTTILNDDPTNSRFEIDDPSKVTLDVEAKQVKDD